MELESLSDGKFSFSYPAEDWEVWEQVTTDYHPLTIFYKGTADDGSTSISVAENDTVVTQLKPELLQVMLDGLKEQAPYMVIKESEMRSMEGTPVFYLEDNMSLTQEGLDMMVDTGAWTEETIEAMGGREALLSNNIASDQINACARSASDPENIRSGSCSYMAPATEFRYRSSANTEIPAAGNSFVSRTAPIYVLS